MRTDKKNVRKYIKLQTPQSYLIKFCLAAQILGVMKTRTSTMTWYNDKMKLSNNDFFNN